MILGKIIGKSSTNQFMFLVEKQSRKFQYVQVLHQEGYYVLAQIVEIEKEKELTIAKCNVLGYRQDGILKNLRVPLEPGTEVLYAEDNFVSEALNLENEKGAYIGVLEDREKLKVYLDLNKILTKHILILAKTGSGKTYGVGVLLEEILEKSVPIVVIDPHGEYSSLKYPAENRNFGSFGIKVKGYLRQIQEFSPDIEKNSEARSLKISTKNLTGSELIHLLPAKLSGSQVAVLYSTLKDSGGRLNFDQIILSLEAEESSVKWTLINLLEYMRNLNIFSDAATGMHELVIPGKCSIVNLKGVPLEVQEVVVYKLLHDLFKARKLNEVPPFFLVIEEAHIFCPERSFGEAKSSNIIRNIAAEGRKFGLGLCVVSQRAARIDKNVLSQTGTQIILKLTNPNDLRAISSSVEGITSETEREIQNLHTGKAIVIGVVDMPLFVSIRPRKSKHGGGSIDVLETFSDLNVEGEDYNKEVLNVVKGSLTKEDFIIANGLEGAKTVLIPCSLLSGEQGGLNFNLLINLNNATIVTDVDNCNGESLKCELDKLSEKETRIFKIALGLGKEFNASELFAKSGVQFSEIYDIMNILVKKNYFMKTGNNFTLSKSVSIFVNLINFAFYNKSEFLGIVYDEKLNVNYDINEIIGFLSRFVNIDGQKEVWLVKYA